MAKSKLAAQLAEAIPLAEALNKHAAAFGELKNNYASDLAPGGGSGGSGAGAGALGSGATLTRPGGMSGETIRQGDVGNDASTQILGTIDASGEAERLAELDAAARWFGIPLQVMHRASRAEQDRLLENFRAIGSPGYEAGFATQGSGATSGAARTGTSHMPADILGGANGLSQSAYSPLATQRSGVAESSAQAAKSAPDPTPAVMAGAQATVQALGSVVTELKRLNDNVSRKSTGVEYRTGGLT